MTESGRGIGAAQVIDVWRRLAEANVRYYGGWARVTREYADDLLASFRSAPKPAQASRAAPTGSPPRQRPAAMLLEADAGKHAEAAFVLHASSGERLRARPAVPAFVDPSGDEIVPVVVFEPAEIDLGPGQELVVHVRAEIDTRMKPMVPYEGEVVVPGLPEAAIRLVLRRTGSSTTAKTKPRARPSSRTRSTTRTSDRS
jgi:hypothetical protein